MSNHLPDRLMALFSKLRDDGYGGDIACLADAANALRGGPYGAAGFAVYNSLGVKVVHVDTRFPFSAQDVAYHLNRAHWAAGAQIQGTAP